jgi:hypothetical protein
MRNMLLIMAVALLATAVLVDPGRLSCYMAGPAGPIAAVFAAGTALIFAMAVRQHVGHILRGPEEPWYVRPGAIVLLVVIMPCAALAFTVFDIFTRFSPSLAAAVSMPARILGFLSLFLVWIAILDWPTHGFRRPQRGPSHPYSGNKSTWADSPREGPQRDDEIPF